jgi:hypothetical protein
MGLRSDCYSLNKPGKMETINDPRYNFDADPTLDEIVAQQGKHPVHDVSTLHGQFWPEEESIGTEDHFALLT